MTNSDTRQGIIRSMSHCKLLKFRCLLMSLLLFVCSLPAAGEFETTKEAAEQEDAEAQFNLGVMYDRGEGVPEDNAEATRWYRLAAEQGDDMAQNSIGLMYDRGDGMPEDNTEAVRWYRMAAVAVNDADINARAQEAANRRGELTHARDKAKKDVNCPSCGHTFRVSR